MFGSRLQMRRSHLLHDIRLFYDGRKWLVEKGENQRIFKKNGIYMDSRRHYLYPVNRDCFQRMQSFLRKRDQRLQLAANNILGNLLRRTVLLAAMVYNGLCVDFSHYQIFRKQALHFPPLCLTIIVGLLCLNLLLGSYDFLLPFHPWQPFSNINVFTTALPFVMLGGFIKLHFHTLHGIFTKPTARLCLIALSYLEVAALWVVGSKDGDVFIMTPFLSMAILAWFISHPTFGKGSCFTNIGKEYSLNIYLLHFIIIWSVGETCKHYHLNIRNIEFLIVFPLTLFLCYLINLIAPPLKQAYHKLQNKSDLDL